MAPDTQGSHATEFLRKSYDSLHAKQASRDTYLQSTIQHPKPYPRAISYLNSRLLDYVTNYRVYRT